VALGSLRTTVRRDSFALGRMTLTSVERTNAGRPVPKIVRLIAVLLEEIGPIEMHLRIGGHPEHGRGPYDNGAE
jgi:hypothetical protein